MYFKGNGLNGVTIGVFYDCISDSQVLLDFIAHWELLSFQIYSGRYTIPGVHLQMYTFGCALRDVHLIRRNKVAESLTVACLLSVYKNFVLQRSALVTG